jgi:hypothetical protein
MRILRKILQEICIPDAGHLDSSEELECQLGNQMKPKQISPFCMTSSESIMSILLDLWQMQAKSEDGKTASCLQQNNISS